MKKKLLFSLLFMFFTLTIFAQSKRITGKVTSADDGSALPGVSVTLKGSNKGTQTSVDGTYSLDVPSSVKSLTFSFIGMQSQEIQIGNKTVVDVALSGDAKQLSEVVVTALGVTREKKSLGYATQELSGMEVNTAKESNFINSLSGKLAGVDVSRNNNMGASTNIVIRGFKSLTGNNQALFVVDGVPMDNTNTNSLSTQQSRGGYDYGNAASDINPDDIESMNVLKGAAATALYGSRAANGVVMITTKRGRANKGLGLTVNLGYTVGKIDKNTFPKYQTQYGGGYGAYYEDASGFFLYRDSKTFAPVDAGGVLVVPMSEDASYGAKFNPATNVYQWDSFDPTSPNYGKAYPWQMAANTPAAFFNDSKTFNASVALDGGNEKGVYRIAYTHMDQTGILPNSSLQKNTFAFNGTYDFTNKLTATTTFNYVRQDGLGRYSNGYNDNVMTSYRQWYETNVDMLSLKSAFDRTGKNVTWNWADPTDLTPIYWNNPYWQRHNDYETDWRNRIYGNVELNYKFTDWFKVLGRVSMDTYTEQQEERVAIGSIDNSGVSKYSRFDHNFSEINYDLMANFHKNITTDFNLTGLLGYNIRDLNNSSMFSSTNGGLVVPGLYALGNSVGSISAPTENQYEIYQHSIYGSASLGYKDFLFLDLAVRQDVSSTLPISNNTYLYPSASLGFVFSNLIHQDWLDFGKLRLNYAEVGNSAPPLSLTDTYGNGTLPSPFGTTTLFNVATTKNNPNLKPERTKSSEIGLDLQFLKKRLGLDATYYVTNTIDQIMPVALSRATGYNFMYVNAGTIQNKGVELALWGLPIKTKDFSWRIGANFTRNRNQVVELFPGVTNLVLGSFQQGVTLNATVGQPYGVLKGTNFTYLNGQKIVGSNGYYAKSATATEVIGNINPDYKLGITNTFKYKSLSFSFLIDIKKGGSVFSLDQAYGLATGLYPETAFTNDLGNPVRNAIADGGGYIVPGVLADGSANAKRVSAVNYGLFGYVRNPNAAFIYDASYAKLREVALTYQIPTDVLGGSKFVKGATLSLVGRNLWIISKNLPYADPEDGASSGNISGFQSGVYPSVKEIGVNLKLSF